MTDSWLLVLSNIPFLKIVPVVFFSLILCVCVCVSARSTVWVLQFFSSSERPVHQCSKQASANTYSIYICQFLYVCSCLALYKCTFVVIIIVSFLYLAGLYLCICLCSDIPKFITHKHFHVSPDIRNLKHLGSLIIIVDNNPIQH